MANKLNKIWSTTDTGLVKFVESIVIVAALALALVMVAQIIMRYWLMLPFLGIEETSVLLGLWLYLLGGAYCTRQGTHIKGGIVHLVFKKPKTQRSVRFAMSLVCVIASIIFSYWSIWYLITIITIHKLSTYLHWPMSIWVGCLPLGFVLMTVYFGVEAIRYWQELRQQPKGGS